MSKSQPIKNLERIEQLKQYYLSKGDIRDYTLITLGLNTGLRIGDLLNLKWKDVYDFKKNRFKKHINLIEQKTQKQNFIALNKAAITCLKILKNSLENINSEHYIIKSSQNVNKPIDRTQAFRIIKQGAKSIGIEENISCHSMRKTFGYWAWKNGVPPVIIMNIFNHSSIEITKLYLSIDQDDKDDVFMHMNL